MLEENLDIVNMPNQRGLTPLLKLLSRATQNKSLLKKVSKFIELDVDINHVDRSGRNALHYLCKNYRKDDIIEIVQLFVTQKIDVDCIDNEDEGQTAMDFLPSDQFSSTIIDKLRQILTDCKQKEVSKTESDSVAILADSDKENVNENNRGTEDEAPPNKKVKQE